MLDNLNANDILNFILIVAGIYVGFFVYSQFKSYYRIKQIKKKNFHLHIDDKSMEIAASSPITLHLVAQYLESLNTLQILSNLSYSEQQKTQKILKHFEDVKNKYETKMKKLSKQDQIKETSKYVDSLRELIFEII